METKQRVVKQLAQKDSEQMSKLLRDVSHLVEILNTSYSMMQDFSQLAAEVKAVDILTEDVIAVSRFREVHLSTSK